MKRGLDGVSAADKLRNATLRRKMQFYVTPWNRMAWIDSGRDSHESGNLGQARRVRTVYEEIRR